MPTYTFKHGGASGTFKVDADLDEIRIKEFPRIDIGVVEFPVITSNVGVTEFPEIRTRVTGLPRIEISANTDSNVNVAIKEIPDVRAHAPAHWDLCFSVFGLKVWSFSICGESQLITEKYAPRGPEICE